MCSVPHGGLRVNVRCCAVIFLQSLGSWHNCIPNIYLEMTSTILLTNQKRLESLGKLMGLSHNSMVIARIIEYSAFTLFGDNHRHSTLTTVSRLLTTLRHPTVFVALISCSAIKLCAEMTDNLLSRSPCQWSFPRPHLILMWVCWSD